MTDWNMAIILVYLLIGYLISDTLLVKVNTAYWFTMLFYPFVVVGFVLLLLVLSVAIKYYEAKDWINELRT